MNKIRLSCWAAGTLILGLLLWKIAPAFFEADTTPIAFKQESLTIQTADKSEHFNVEIAETEEQQERGLMYRTSLPADQGMLFIFSDAGEIAMWMKNTILSLDMLFIDEEGKIVYIAPRTTPYSTDVITAGQPVQAVLELPGGTAEMEHIKVGDRVISPYFSP